MTATTLSGMQATIALARLALRRVLRGKAVWFALGLGVLPLLGAAVAGADKHGAWDELTATFALLTAIIAPILVTSSLSDEIDDRTGAYLWSRAIPRWSVVSGKLLGLTPVVALSIVIGATVSWATLGGPGAVPAAEFGRSLVGLVAGAVGCSAIAALVATLAPRFAVPLAVGWLLLDAVIGALDFGLHVLAVSYGARTIIDGDGGAVGPLSLAILTVLALAIACYRVDKIE